MANCSENNDDDNQALLRSYKPKTSEHHHIESIVAKPLLID